MLVNLVPRSPATTLKLLEAAHTLQRLLYILQFMVGRLSSLVSQSLSRAALLHATRGAAPPAAPQAPMRTRAAARAADGAAAAAGESLEAVLARLAVAAAAEPPAAPVADKHAACLVPLFAGVDGRPRVWLTRRAAHLRTHAGEVCLPGGRRDEADGGDDAVTALREAHEELGLEPGSVQVCALLLHCGGDLRWDRRVAPSC